MVCDDSLLLCGQVHGSHDYIHVLADVFKLKCCHHCHNDERMALLLPKEGKGGGPHPLLLKISLTWSVKPQECIEVTQTTLMWDIQAPPRPHPPNKHRQITVYMYVLGVD